MEGHKSTNDIPRDADLFGTYAYPEERLFEFSRQTYMKGFLLPGFLLAGLAVASCGHSNQSRNDSSDVPGFHRESNPVFSSQERGIIVVAQRHLTQSDKRPAGASNDAFYRVRTNANGYEVFVIYVTSYEGNRPLFTPCVHNEVFLKHDGSLVKVLVGPECWPSR